MCCWECKYLRWDDWWNPTFYCYNDRKKMSDIMHKETIANYGLKKSEQKEGKIFLIEQEK